MSAGSLFWLSICGLVLAALAATGSKVLQEFSRHELEAYCRRQRRRELFGEILSLHDEAALAAEGLQVVGSSVLLLAGGLWLLNGDQFSPGRLAAAVAVATLLLLMLTSWIPWAVVNTWSAPFLFYTWRLWKLLRRVLRPLVVGGELIESLVLRLSGRPETEPDEEEAFEEEIRTIVTAGLREGLLEADAREMIEGVIELGDADVADIMTPRSNVDAMDVDLRWAEMLRFVIEAGRTRIPVYEKTLDQIVGILYVKDLLPELAKKHDELRRPLSALLREAWFVPATKAVDDLLQEFLRTRNHMAVVLDEYRSVAGVVTIEDVLEEIVGEIVDESDKEVEEEIKPISDSAVEALGRTHLYEVNEFLGLSLPEPDDYDTIAGFVISRLGRIPQTGDYVEQDGVRVTVVEATRRRIERVRIELLEEHEQEIR